jgi:mRNA-degrading endonuclease RelE of RelBE toxin-antitoxin system
MPEDRKIQVKAALAEAAALPDPLAHPQVLAMTGDWKGCLRIRVGTYRAIFQCLDRDGVPTMEVLQVGPRGDVYG